MVADAISYVSGSVFGILAVIGLLLNITVMVAMYRGRLFSSKFSPVYILSAQTILVDTLLLFVHLGYHSPSVAIQSSLFSPQSQPIALAILNATFMYCWYHNSLSHLLVSLNRFLVIVFNQYTVFTRKKTILLCIVQHLLALTLSITSQFLLPCCEFCFSYVVFSYQYITKPNIENYSNEFIDLPLNSASSIVSMIAYSTSRFE
ncbi:hypothetical protein PFISCL1PPCAC_8347 [Pristionchus fissidentatus]|uniref:7TM GPCR serpentine receptor class x (Srx) domain-containing protein n=1 Tax=Pristionchus fissidentatus TaxID=1538716 RepID=A0AAV5VEP1_9BILA|nr:hypothetical protein PFISCL1PPCAC_8347 [Pristionchus fissidentatus]